MSWLLALMVRLASPILLAALVAPAAFAQERMSSECLAVARLLPGVTYRQFRQRGGDKNPASPSLMSGTPLTRSRRRPMW